MTSPGAGGGLMLTDDLIFGSRIAGTARDLGLSVRPVRTVAALEEAARRERPACVLVDLAFPGLNLDELLRVLDSLPGGRPRVVAYGPHVDAAGLRAARQAGCDLVLPRSAFVERLAGDLPAWLTP